MNHLIVILDDLGNELLPWSPWPQSQLRARRPSMPFLTGMIAGGKVFGSFYTMPACSTTRASYITTKLPYAHGIGKALGQQDGISLDPAHGAWWADLQDQGYWTALHGKWHLSDDPDHPRQFGLHRWSGHLFNVDYQIPMDWWISDDQGTRTVQCTKHPSEAVADAVTADLDEIDDSPFVITAAFQSVHKPYHDPPPHLYSTPYPTGDEEGQLLAMAESIDAACSQIWAGMSPTQRVSTRWWVFADNGTDPAYNVAPQGSGKGTTGQGGINTALAVFGGPPIVQDPVFLADEEDPISVCDVGPTIRQCIGLPYSTPVTYGWPMGGDPRAMAASQKIDPPPAGGTPIEDCKRVLGVARFDGWKLRVRKMPSGGPVTVKWYTIDGGLETEVPETQVPDLVREAMLRESELAL